MKIVWRKYYFSIVIKSIQEDKSPRRRNSPNELNWNV